MNSFLVSFNIVAPIFLLIALGYVLKSIGFFKEGTIGDINKFIHFVLLPSLLFYNTYKGDYSSGVNFRLIAFVMCALVIITCIYFLAVPAIEKDNKKRGVLIHALIRGNTAMFGIPIGVGLLGNGNLSNLIFVMACLIIVYSAIGVIILETYDENCGSVKKIFIGIVKSPLLIACGVGLLLSLSRIKLPAVIESPINGLSSATIPIAFVCLGASLKFKSIVKNRKYIMATAAFRLFIIPAAVLFIGCGVLGFRGVETASLLTAFATPTAVTTFSMAKASKSADSDLASELVAFLTMLSMPSMLIFIYALQSLGYV